MLATSTIATGALATLGFISPIFSRVSLFLTTTNSQGSALSLLPGACIAALRIFSIFSSSTSFVLYSRILRLVFTTSSKSAIKSPYINSFKNLIIFKCLIPSWEKSKSSILITNFSKLSLINLRGLNSLSSISFEAS